MTLTKKPNWIDPADLEVLKPNKEQLQQHWAELTELVKLAGGDEEQAYQIFNEHLDGLRLFFVQGDFVGGVHTIRLGRKSAELHISCRREWQRRGVPHFLMLAVLDELFHQTRLKNIIGKFTPSNKLAKACAHKWGATFINRDNGLLVYRLRKRDYELRRR